MRPEKANIVDDLQVSLNNSPYLFVTDYTGLRVDQFSELRNRLAGAGARCHVVKNTFLRIAAEKAGMPELKSLKGQTAIIVGDKDVAAAAKVLKTFVTEFKKPEVKSGVIDRAVVSADQINTIADLPSREILLATLLGVFNAPATKLVRVLNEPASALARVLQAKVDQGGGVPAPEPAAEIPAEAPAEAPVAEAAAPEAAAEAAAPAAETPAPETPAAE